MSLKQLERDTVASARTIRGNVVDIAEWLEQSSEDFSSGPVPRDREAYWQSLLRQKLNRSKADEPGRHTEDLATLFHRLADDWKRATMACSSMTEIVLHPSYQRIIGLGDPVVPLILEELQREPYHWFWALASITGEDPGADETTLDGATARWNEWATRRHLLPAAETA